MKWLKERCLECSICAMFFNSLLAVFMTALLRSRSQSSARISMFRIVAHMCDELYSVDEEHLEKGLDDISPVSVGLATDVLHVALVPERVAVVRVAGGNHEVENLSVVVDDQVQLEAVEPSYGGFSFLGRPEKVRCECMRLMWRTLSAVESVKLMPVHLSRSTSRADLSDRPREKLHPDRRQRTLPQRPPAGQRAHP